MDVVDLDVDYWLPDEHANTGAINALIESLQVSSPCDECPTRSLCAQDLIACEAFNAFVNAPRHKAGTSWRGKDRYPSRAIFESVMSDADGQSRRAAVNAARREAKGYVYR